MTNNRKNPMNKHALIVVDEQVDFISGTLAVTDAEEVIAPSLELAAGADLVVATRDWHPANHLSFSDDPQYTDMSWPAHCVAGTDGASIPDELETIADVIVNKGILQNLETYSAFAAEIEVAKCPIGHWVGRRVALAELLIQLGVGEVTVVGLATDYCVIATAKDALAAGFTVTIDRRACRAVVPEHGDEVLASFADGDRARVIG